MPEGDPQQAVPPTADKLPTPRHNPKARVSDGQLYEQLRDDINTTSTAHLKDHHADLYRVYRTLDEFEKDELRQYLRGELLHREDSVGQFWSWILWRSRGQRINYAEFARLININRTEVTRKIRPQAIQAYAEALVKVLKFFYASVS